MKFLLVASVFCFYFLGCQGANDTHYRAAVVEYAPVIGNLSVNTEQYVNFIQEASQEGVDIIVFPENAWNGPGPCTDDMLTAVPHPRANVVPCYPPGAFTLISKALQELSCAAKEHGIYVVVNLREYEMNPGVYNGSKQYNTNVVLDRNGMLIARYRKFNLFGEDANITPEPELAIFDTDFGVRFGTFICFDLMFDRPALQLVQQLAITDIVFSTFWFSELPFLTAVQAQEMWAYAQDVNFIGAGLNNPSTGSGGSGIYAGRQGSIVSTFPSDTTTELLIADVPKKGLRSLAKPVPVQQRIPKASASTLFLKQDDLSAYKSVALEDISTQTRVCHDEFCCKFSVSYTPPTNGVDYRYQAVVFSGVRSFDGFATGGVQACAIVSCSNDSVSSCGVRITSEHFFNQINITSTFVEKHTAQMPSTLRLGEQLLPLDASEYSYTSTCEDGLCDVDMRLEGKIDNLITFGIYGRNFAADGLPASSAGILFVNLLLVLSAVLALLCGK